MHNCFKDVEFTTRGKNKGRRGNIRIPTGGSARQHIRGNLETSVSEIPITSRHIFQFNREGSVGIETKDGRFLHRRKQSS